MPAAREGDERVTVEKQRISRTGEADQVERAQERDREGKVALQAPETRDSGEQDDRKRQEANGSIAPPEPGDRGDDAEDDERDRDRILEVGHEVFHAVTFRRRPGWSEPAPHL